MAEEHEEFVSALFPSPPPFYQNFTAENVTRLKKFKEDAGLDGKDDVAPQLSVEQLLSLPSELRYLIPPEPPAESEEYTVFNEKVQLNRPSQTIQDWGIEQLYPSPPSPQPGEDTTIQADWTFDRQIYLRNLARSILLNFVELLGMVAEDPTTEAKLEKFQDISTIVKNMHALINEYRPHQARETLINMMEEQLERKRAEVDGIKRMKEKVEETFVEFSKNAPESEASAITDGLHGVAADEKRGSSQRRMWQGMGELVGH